MNSFTSGETVLSGRGWPTKLPNAKTRSLLARMLGASSPSTLQHSSLRWIVYVNRLKPLRALSTSAQTPKLTVKFLEALYICFAAIPRRETGQTIFIHNKTANSRNRSSHKHCHFRCVTKFRNCHVTRLIHKCSCSRTIQGSTRAKG